MTQVPNSKKYDRPNLSAGDIFTSPHGLVRPVEVFIICGGIVVANGFAEGNLRVHVRRQVSRARRAQVVNRDVRPVVGGSLDGVVERIDRMNRWSDRCKDRSWKGFRSAQYKPVFCEFILGS